MVIVCLCAEKIIIFVIIALLASKLKLIPDVADYLVAAGQEVAHSDWSSAHFPVDLVLHTQMSRLCLKVWPVRECDALNTHQEYNNNNNN